MYSIHNLNIIHNTTLKKIIDDLSFSVQQHDKLALIGEEGTGKSTLIKALINEPLEYAHYHPTTKAIINYVPQSVQIEESIMEYLINNSVDYAKLYSLLNGFKIKESILERESGTSLSGGENTKLALVKAFAYESDLIILDEPTNNLDLKSIKYLEELCVKSSTPIIFASHDTVFIESIATSILHFETVKKRTINNQTLYNMNFIAFKKHRSSTITNEVKKYESGKKEIKRAEARFERINDSVSYALDTVSRQDPLAAKNLKDKMSQVKNVSSRIEVKRTSLVEPSEYEDPVNFTISSLALPSSKIVLDLNLDTLNINDKVLSKNISLKIIGPQKIIIIGDNGVGKTTLINEIIKQAKVSYAYMAQSYSDVMNVNKNSIEQLCDISIKEEVIKTTTYLGSLNFSYDEMHLPFNQLSGGQKAKVFFAKLALNQTQLLILDEPTRNISPLSLDVLLEQLNDYKGAIIMVTHDRKLLKSLHSKVYELSSSGLANVNIDDYL